MDPFFKTLPGRILARFKLQDGMTLLEVLLALALAGASAAVLTASFMQAAHTREQLNWRVTAQILGAGKLAELTGGSELSNYGKFPEPYQKFEWTASEEKTEAGLSVVWITVEWRRGNDLLQKTMAGYKEPED